MTQDQQIAAFARQLVSNSTAKTDDETQSAIIATKQWLERIAKGEVILVVPKAPKVKPAP